MPNPLRRDARRALLIAASCLLGGMAAPADAQVGALQTPARDFELREPEIAPEPPPERILPPVQPAPRPLAGGLRVDVAGFRFEGNTVFDDAELAAVVAPWTGRQIASEELEAAREALTRHYVDAGYVSSGALVPDQELEDGVVRVRIVEGRLVRVVVEGTRSYRPSYFEHRLMLYGKRPLRIQDLEERLQVFQQDPRIERLAARLGPGEARGDAVLRLDVAEALPFRALGEWSNDTPAGLGEQTGRVGAQYSNLLGVGDRLSGLFRGTEGLIDFEAQYRVPLTSWDTEVAAHLRYSEGEVVRGPFQVADIDSEAMTVGFSFLQPLWRTRATSLQLAIIGDWRRSQTRVGDTFSFPGTGADEETGISKLTALRLGGEWIHRTRTRVAAFRQIVSFGIPILDYTNNASRVPDGEFVSSLSQLRLALRLPDAAYAEVAFRTDLQLGSEPLMPLEQIGVGGLATVRGYAENEIVRDQAVISSFELRFPLYRDLTERHVLQVGPFVDVGHAWNHSRKGPDLKDQTVLGAGIGLRYRFRHFLFGELYWAPLTSDDQLLPLDLQGDGVHFRVRLQLP